jgi:hypothetical protein
MKKSIILLIASSVLILAGCATSHRPETTARFQVSSWAYAGEGERSHGCYIIDTWTGELWAVGGAQPGSAYPTKVSGPLK